MPDAVFEARREARALLERFGVRAPGHIHVEAWAERLGVELAEAPLDGAVAQLQRRGDGARIVLSDRVTDRGARRFSIAHELCHFLLRHPSPSASMLCTPKHYRRNDDALRACEQAANAFAGDVLLPASLLRRACEVSPVSLDVPWAIARDFDVSILAATIRFVELTSERCAAVFSCAKTVRWFAPSATFTREIPRGRPLDRSSVAWDFFASGRLDDRPQPVPADAWFDTSASVELIEHSIASDAHGTVLSLLWVPESVGPKLGMIS